MANKKTNSGTNSKKASQKRKKPTQRVDEFKKNFHALHETGMSTSEIARQYDVDISYAYKLLDGIAATNGVTRDYYKVKENFGSSSGNLKDSSNSSYTHYTNEDYKSILCAFDNCLSDIKTLNQRVEAMKKEHENDKEEER